MGATVPDTLSAREIAASVAAGRLCATQVAEAALSRIAAFDAIQPQIWIERPPAAAILARAASIDAQIAAGTHLPLAGVPYAVKDNIDVAGLPTTAGCPAFAYQPTRSASVIERLEEAGAVMMGKTNLDQFATGLVGTRSPYGAPTCLYNRAYISGGSSSGSAVATAAGLVAFALGTDTAGSGRVPAAINGLIGFKPTKGSWSTRGLVPACRSLDCISLFTTHAADARLIDSTLAFFDPQDAYARHAPPHDTQFGAQFRFGIARADQLNFMGDRQSQSLFDAAIARLEAMGGTAVTIDIAPLLDAAKLLYGGPWVGERTAAIEPFLRANPAAIHPTVRAIIQGGAAISAIDTFRGLYALQDHLRAAESLWSGIDILLLPTAPTIYRLDEVLAEPFTLNANLGLYTNFVNLLDMSAVAVPAGWRDNATGFGVSLIGPAWSDHALLALAHRYEQIAPPPSTPPIDASSRPQTITLAVVGAHLAGMPLHWQLTTRHARFIARTHTAPLYKLYAMRDTQPPKPALVHVSNPEHGAAIEIELYELTIPAFGSFVADVPAPLAIGSVTLQDGSVVKGFVAEPRAMIGAEDITAFGGWRGYLAGG